MQNTNRYFRKAAHPPRDQRHVMNGFLLVTDNKTGEIVGKLVNISKTGLCLLINEEFASNCANGEINLSVGLESSKRHIELEIERVWTKEIERSTNFLAGYTYTVKNLKSKQRIKDLIQASQN